MGLFGSIKNNLTKGITEERIWKIKERFEELKKYKPEFYDMEWPDVEVLLEEKDGERIGNYFKHNKTFKLIQTTIENGKKAEKQLAEQEAGKKARKELSDHLISQMDNPAGELTMPTKFIFSKMGSGTRQYSDAIWNVLGVGDGSPSWSQGKDHGKISDNISGGMIKRPTSSLSSTNQSLLKVMAKGIELGFLNDHDIDEIYEKIIWNMGSHFFFPNTEHTENSLAVMTMFCQLNNDEQTFNQIRHLVTGIIDSCNEAEQDFLLSSSRKGNRWFQYGDFESSILTEDKGSLILGILDTPERETYPIMGYDGEAPLLTIAPTRSGKTQAQVIPSLLHSEASAVVLDIKGELFDLTSKRRQEMGHKIIRWNGIDKAGSHSYDLLASISKDPDDVWADCQAVAKRLICDIKGEKDPFWKQEARNLVTLHLADMTLDKTEQNRTMGRLLEKLSQPNSELEYACEGKFREWANQYDLQASLGACANGVKGLLKDNPKQYRSFVQSAASELRIFESPAVLRNLKKSDWRPEDLQKEKMTVYISIPPEDVTVWAPLLRMIIADHFKGLQRSLIKDAPRVTFFLDECAALGNFPELVQTLAQGAGFGIRPWLFFQDIGQINNVYDNPEGILGNCAVQSFMNPKAETARELSQRLGVSSSIIKEEEEPLARPEELEGPGFKDNVIIMAQGSYPIRAIKSMAFRYWEDLFGKADIDFNKEC